MELHFGLTRLLNILSCFSIGIPLAIILRSYFGTIRLTASNLTGTMLYKLHIINALLIVSIVFSFSAVIFVLLYIK